ncbi:TetR family transcriptional regulator [Microbacterium sp. dk485]|uniref:TetR/AcrR family transcriptional regulator n=1 Tax=Microbacterium TaxID=33882 RepID=UPI001074952A|nr:MULTISPECIES: TetR/AcrR family transcriptional regulator [Microbacterium]TFV82277.1 TetR family transcriptional regulator [Microbacterium sp. dk485]TXK20396.1 TetR/AcrR family transcriptional regulator [Microbacterium wangchenii]
MRDHVIGEVPGTRGRIDKRLAMLDAAFRIFADVGYEQASVESIAAEAGVAKATIYNHFGDKERMFREVLRADGDRALGDHLEIVATLVTPSNNIRAALEHVGLELLIRYFDPKTVWYRRLLVAGRATFPDVLESVRTNVTERVMAALADRLSELMRRGQLRDADPAVAAEQFWALLVTPAENRTQLGTRDVTSAELRESTSRAVDTFLRAFGA